MKSYFDEAAAHWDDQPQRVKLMQALGEAIVREAQPTADMRVLDYGCGTGLLGLYLLPRVRRVTGADNSPAMLEVLRRKIAQGQLQNMQAIRLDLERDPAPANRFDLIVVGMALHHIAELDRTLRGLCEMLLPGGALCLADLDTEPGVFHPAAAAASVHHHGFDREQLKRQLAQIGLVRTKDVTAVEFTKPIEAGGEHSFSIFLITGWKQGARPKQS